VTLREHPAGDGVGCQTEDAMIKLLHVEDDADIREIVLLSLDFSGEFEVVQCESGEDAVKQVKTFTPDVVLLDFMMPGMTGSRTLEEMRKVPQMVNVPVIFLTAKTLHTEVEEFHRIGAAGVIIKPFDVLSLACQVKAVMSGELPKAALYPVNINQTKGHG